LYSTGLGKEGAIGTGMRENNYGFKLIMNKVKKISAGRDHSLAIKENKVFGWGNT
jgi:alpha-tubulin suppressor-like RCC1 family protein